MDLMVIVNTYVNISFFKTGTVVSLLLSEPSLFSEQS